MRSGCQYGTLHGYSFRFFELELDLRTVCFLDPVQCGITVRQRLLYTVLQRLAYC